MNYAATVEEIYLPGSSKHNVLVMCNEHAAAHPLCRLLVSCRKVTEVSPFLEWLYTLKIIRLILLIHVKACCSQGIATSFKSVPTACEQAV